MARDMEQGVIEGRPALAAVDIGGGAPTRAEPSALPIMPGYGRWLAQRP